MASEEEDLDIIGDLVDANCRAYSEEYGDHYDSRCLEHYNRAIARLIEKGRIQHKPPAADKAKSQVGKGVVKFDAEVVGGNEHPRLRSSRVSVPQQVARPTTDPVWTKWQNENQTMRAELDALRSSHGNGPE